MKKFRWTPAFAGVTAFVVFIGITGIFQVTYSQDRPNILWIVCEDISPHLGAYGVEDVRTPVLDQLASEGVLYTNAFVTAPVCAVMRAALLSGTFSTTQGSHHMRNNANFGENVEPYPTIMRAAGYWSTNPNKTDYQGMADINIWNNNPTNYMDRSDKNMPFLHVANHTGTHESNGRNDAGSYNIADITSLPPYYPDTDKSRTTWASYFHNITNMDTWVGQRLTELENSGEADNTIVFFYSDHGVGFPRGKRWAYDSGLRIPLIVRVPARWQSLMPHQPGSQTNELVSTIDLTATLMNLAEVDKPDYMQGRAFVGSDLTPERTYIYGHRDRMDERYELIRVVRDKRYKYIRNYENFKPHQQHNQYPEENNWSGIMEEIRRVYEAPNTPPEIAWFFEFKPREEFYDLEQDPHEMNDLASDPAHRTRIADMRAAHLEFRKTSRDLGAVPEPIILTRRNGFTGEYDYGVANENEVHRAFEVLDSLGLYTSARLITLLDDDDAAIRYWAATGLGNMGDNSQAVTNALTTALGDGNQLVEAAAARGLLLLGTSQAALDKLVSVLSNGSTYEIVYALQVIDDMGTKAASITGDLSNASGNYADRLIQRINVTIGDPPRVPPVVTGCLDVNYVEYDPTATQHDDADCLTSAVSKPKPGENKSFEFDGDYLKIFKPGPHTLTLFDLSGRLITRLSGTHSRTYDIKAGMGQGAYFVKLKTGNNIITKTIIIH